MIDGAEDVAPASRARPRGLGALDAAAVPAIQRFTRRVGTLLWASVGPLARWEDRLASGRPLAFATRHRGTIVLVTAVIAFVGSFLHLDRYPDLRATEAAVQPPSIGAGVGPYLGADLRRYVDGRKSALASLPPTTRISAVISFERYLAVDELGPLLAPPLVIGAVQLRAPVAGAEPRRLVVGDEGIAATVAAAIAPVRTELEVELRDVRSTLRSGVGDPAFERDYLRRERELERSLAELESDPAVVFALLIEGDVGDLQALGEAPGVRLVDPAPADLVGAEQAYGLLPEDVERASYGRQL